MLTGERRAYLKQGVWTYLFPATISARTYLKQKDFAATGMLVSMPNRFRPWRRPAAESIPSAYLNRGWRHLLSNHTHDANGGSPPTPFAGHGVSLPQGFRHRRDCRRRRHGPRGGQPFLEGQPADSMQLLVVNPLPFVRDAVTLVDVEMPAGLRARNVRLPHPCDPAVAVQPISYERGLLRRFDLGRMRFSTATASKFYAELKTARLGLPLPHRAPAA